MWSASATPAVRQRNRRVARLSLAFEEDDSFSLCRGFGAERKALKGKRGFFFSPRGNALSSGRKKAGSESRHLSEIT